MPRHILPLLLILVALSGCTTLRQTEPTQTARHQLLLSTAADEASARIEPNVPAGNRIYIDTSNFVTGDEYRSEYAITAIKRALLREGYGLAASADNADTILAVSSGALSIDNTSHLLGIPSATVPIPLAGPFKTPELALWKNKERTGIAKFLLVFYDAKTGVLQDADEPVYGFSHYDRSSILFYGRTKSNLLPARLKERKNQD